MDGADEYLNEEGTKVAITAVDMKAQAKMVLTIDLSLFVHIHETKITTELWRKLYSLPDDSEISQTITLFCI